MLGLIVCSVVFSPLTLKVEHSFFLSIIKNSSVSIQSYIFGGKILVALTIEFISTYFPYLR